MTCARSKTASSRKNRPSVVDTNTRQRAAAVHGEDLTGANARALVGDTFLRNWSSLSLDGLFDRVQTMPPGGAMTLGEDTYVDILTYVLETNGFPAGSDELRTETLPEIIVEGADGPQEVPDFSLVQVVGCLTSGPGNTWILTDATEPIRTLDPAASINEGRILVETVTLRDRFIRVDLRVPGSGRTRGAPCGSQGLSDQGRPGSNQRDHACECLVELHVVPVLAANSTATSEASAPLDTLGTP